jgi:hypothetical protein
MPLSESIPYTSPYTFRKMNVTGFRSDIISFFGSGSKAVDIISNLGERKQPKMKHK